MIFAWTKIAASRTSKTTNTGDTPTPTEPAAPLSPLPPAPTEVVVNDGTPDWLKSSESPFGSEDILSQEVSQSSTEAHTPDWMNDHAEKEVASTPAITPPAIEASAEVPDWLKETPKEEVPVSEKSATTPTPEEIHEPVISHEETAPATISSEDTSKVPTTSSDDDIPDWLRGADVAPVEEKPVEAPVVPEIEQSTVKPEETSPEIPQN